MALYKKKPDPLSERARALKEEIAALNSKIRKLNAQEKSIGGPRLRSTTLPSAAGEAPAPAAPPPPKAPDPIFEEVEQKVNATEPESTPQHFNDLGVRKYDFVAFLRRIQNHFRGKPVTSNPKLIHYLAAGSVQGLRPLRYEKRVARNRVIFLTVVLLLMLWGIIAVLVGRH